MGREGWMSAWRLNEKKKCLSLRLKKLVHVHSVLNEGIDFKISSTVPDRLVLYTIRQRVLGY